MLGTLTHPAPRATHPGGSQEPGVMGPFFIFDSQIILVIYIREKNLIVRGMSPKWDGKKIGVVFRNT